MTSRDTCRNYFLRKGSHSDFRYDGSSGWLFALLFTLTLPCLTWAQPYPTKPIRLIVPFSAGGGNDFIGRQIGQKVGEELHQTFVIDNRGGAGGSIGMEMGATATPDGYTLVLGHIGTLAVNPSVYPKLSYDPVRDFQPISVVAKLPALMVVNPGIPATTVAQFVAYAKTKPGAVSYGSGGVGGVNHLATEYFNQLTRIDLIHVPYRGAGQAAVDAIAGQVAMVMSAVPVVLPHVRQGKLRALGVSSATRLSIAPEIPTIAESGVPEFVVSQWYGILAPAKTPKPIVDTLQKAISNALNAPEMKERFAAEGAESSASTPGQFEKLIKHEIARWAPVVKTAGVSP